MRGAYVVDASVAVQPFFPDEPFAGKAMRFIELLETTDSLAAYAPEFLYIEVASVLWKRVRRGEIPEDTGRGDLQALLSLNINVVPMKELTADAFNYARALDISVYDASYIALADLLSLPFVSCDLKLVRKAEAAGFNAITFAALELH